LQTNLEKIKTNRFLLSSLLASGLAVLVANALGKEIAAVTTDLLYIPVSGVLLIFSIIVVIRNRGKGNHGKAYILFSVFVASWFIAELVWLFSELVYHLSPFPQEAEWFYLCGYPFLFLFSTYYLKPFKRAISKKMMSYAFLATMIFLVPTLNSIYSYNPLGSLPEMIWAAIYPIADALVLFPAVLGMVLFFKGQVGLLWSLVFLAIILNLSLIHI